MGKRRNSFRSFEPRREHSPNGKIPSAVALVKGEPEEKKLKISFEYYNEKSCDFLGNKNVCVKPSVLKKVFKVFIKVCTVTPQDLSSANIRVDRVLDTTEYRDLYSSVPEDASLWHCNLGKKERLFYFVASGYFYPVAIAISHR